MTHAELIRAYRIAELRFGSLRYRRKLAHVPASEVHLVTEAHIRVRQLTYLVERFVQLEDEYADHTLSIEDLESVDPEAARDEKARAPNYGEILVLQAESF